MSLGRAPDLELKTETRNPPLKPGARDRGRRRSPHPRAEELLQDGIDEIRTVDARVKPSLDPRLPLPGTLLIRRHQGKDIVVHIRPDRGIECDGRIYKSLSKAV